jgi:hypothetical protein
VVREHGDALPMASSIPYSMPLWTSLLSVVRTCRPQRKNARAVTTQRSRRGRGRTGANWKGDLAGAFRRPRYIRDVLRNRAPADGVPHVAIAPITEVAAANVHARQRVGATTALRDGAAERDGRYAVRIAGTRAIILVEVDETGPCVRAERRPYAGFAANACRGDAFSGDTAPSGYCTIAARGSGQAALRVVGEDAGTGAVAAPSGAHRAAVPAASTGAACTPCSPAAPASRATAR